LIFDEIAFFYSSWETLPQNEVFFLRKLKGLSQLKRGVDFTMDSAKARRKRGKLEQSSKIGRKSKNRIPQNDVDKTTALAMRGKC